MEHTITSIEKQQVLEQLAQDAFALIDKAIPENTKRAYASDWKNFQAWCTQYCLQSLPATPNTVILYIASLSKVCKVSTIQRRLASISLAHGTTGNPNPIQDDAVKQTFRAIKRKLGISQTGKEPIMLDDLRRLVSATPNNLLGVRDRALMTLGFLGAFRRSELTSLNVEDLDFRDRGLLVTLRCSKTDQEGLGQAKALPKGRNSLLCPYENVKLWIEQARLGEGPLFRRIDKGQRVFTEALTPQSVALIIKKYAKAAGLNPNQLSGHSLRVGFVTEAALKGASERSIMNVTGHKTRAMVDRYVRRADPWTDNAATQLNI